VLEPTRPWEVVAIDVCWPFPTTPNKNSYLLTFMDHLTKYAEAVPINSMTAEECARAYVTHVIARHGASSKLLSDQGRNFTSAFFRETCKILGVKQLFTTLYHPQANGILERFHRSLSKGLAHYVNACANNWGTLVPLYLMAYRNTPHGTGKYSPFYLLHGREMVLTSMHSLRAKLPPEIRETDHEPQLENLKSKLRTAYKPARGHSRKSRAANKQKFQRTRIRSRRLSVFVQPCHKGGRVRQIPKALGWAMADHREEVPVELRDHRPTRETNGFSGQPSKKGLRSGSLAGAKTGKGTRECTSETSSTGRGRISGNLFTRPDSNSRASS
jgi:transposase InsO family protein